MIDHRKGKSNYKIFGNCEFEDQIILSADEQKNVQNFVFKKDDNFLFVITEYETKDISLSINH